MKKIPVVVITQSGLLQQALRHYLNRLINIDNVVFGTNLQDCLTGSIQPSYLIIHAVEIPQPHNYTLEKLKSKSKNCNILVIDELKTDSAAKPYVHNYLELSHSDIEIMAALEKFFDNHPPTSEQFKDDKLSDREREIIQLVALGKTNKEISDQLFISTHTVITHRKNITTKLGIKTIAGLTVYAILNGIINPDDTIPE